MNARETLITAEGLKKLEEEHQHLINVRRKEVALRIKAAREEGDISENAEYDDAKNEQARVEIRITQIEEKLRTAKVITNVDTNSVNIGNTVTVLEDGSKDEEVFIIVGSTEADPLENKVSNESPVGSALMGRKKGDSIEIPVPSGKIKYTIKKISA